jgi:hypothetical protein
LLSGLIYYIYIYNGKKYKDMGFVAYPQSHNCFQMKNYFKGLRFYYIIFWKYGSNQPFGTYRLIASSSMWLAKALSLSVLTPYDNNVTNVFSSSLLNRRDNGRLQTHMLYGLAQESMLSMKSINGTVHPRQRASRIDFFNRQLSLL